MINITNTNVKAVRYTGKASAKGSSDTDLQISFDNNVIGMTNKNVQTGDLVLVMSRQTGKSPSITMFAGRVGGYIEDGVTDWKEQGGLLWRNNWAIKPLSTIQTFSQDELTSLLGSYGTDWNYHIATTAMRSHGANESTIGTSRAKLMRHLLDNFSI